MDKHFLPSIFLRHLFFVPSKLLEITQATVYFEKLKIITTWNDSEFEYIVVSKFLNVFFCIYRGSRAFQSTQYKPDNQFSTSRKLMTQQITENVILFQNYTFTAGTAIRRQNMKSIYVWSPHWKN